MVTALIVLVALYAALCAVLYAAMARGPEAFNALMARTPAAAFLVFPFKPMWLRARRGTLEVGDTAPDFTLERQDKTETIRLSQFRGVRPVVLVFGSYT